jgi:hypothetical protein
MPDTPTSLWKLPQGIALITIMAFIAFFAAGFGWHVAVAFARVLGL